MESQIATTVMGSYPQPLWLVDRTRLVAKGVPRVRAEEIWRVPAEHRAEAIEAATLAVIADQESAGVDIISDGEIGRESYFNHFANALGGVDPDKIGRGQNRIGGVSELPLVTGPIERHAPVEVEPAVFLRAHTSRAIKVTVPGPFTLSQLADNQFYPDQKALAMAYADAVRAELVDLVATGVDVVQIDEPYLQANRDAAAEFAVEAISAAVRGITATTVLHTCYGYAEYVSSKDHGYPFLAELADTPVDFVAIEAAQPGLDLSALADLRPRGVILGVIDLSTDEVETPEAIAARIREALRYVPANELAVAPDCGMKFLTRSVARAKLAAMVAGATLVRAELS